MPDPSLQHRPKRSLVPGAFSMAELVDGPVKCVHLAQGSTALDYFWSRVRDISRPARFYSHYFKDLRNLSVIARNVCWCAGPRLVTLGRTWTVFRPVNDIL